MIPSVAFAQPPCHVTLQAIANVECAMRHLRASRNFYPQAQQPKALLLTFHPVPNNTNSAVGAYSVSPSPPSRPSKTPHSHHRADAPKRRTRKSREIIEDMFTDSAQAGNLVKMLKNGSWD